MYERAKEAIQKTTQRYEQWAKTTETALILKENLVKTQDQWL